MIRDMHKQDIKRIVDIWLSASILAHDFIEYSFWHNKVGKLLHELSLSKAYVYADDDHLVGFLSLKIVDEGKAYINELFIDPRFQRKGYGSKLLQLAKDLYTALELHVYQLNTDTIKFYRDRGFRDDGRHQERETGQFKLKMTWAKHVSTTDNGDASHPHS